MGQARSSHTALRISLTSPLLAQDARLGDLLPEGAAESTMRLLHGAGLLDADSVAAFGRTPRARVGLFFERHLTRGQLLYLGLRKRLVNDEVEEALTTGATQVLVVGAGFDTLGLRLAPSHPGVVFVEIDQPSTLEAKERGSAALGGRPQNLHWLGIDLAETTLETALEGLDRWDRGAQTVVVAEGLLMYLPPPAVAALLEAVHRSCGPETRLVFSYLRPDSRGRPYMGKIGPLLRASLRMVGEPLRWAIADQDLPDFLAGHGFRIDTTPDRCDLRRRYLEPAGLADRPLGTIEGLAVADRLESTRGDR